MVYAYINQDFFKKEFQVYKTCVIDRVQCKI